MSAKADYAVRAMVELAAAGAAPMKAEEIADRQGIPQRFLLNILGELKLHRLVESRRGSEGGYWLARAARDITVADVIRAVEGPLADVHGVPPEQLDYPEPVAALREVWLGTRAAIRSVLEAVSLADVVAGKLPRRVRDQLGRADAWQRRP